jgi:hypothetical protein
MNIFLQNKIFPNKHFYSLHYKEKKEKKFLFDFYLRDYEKSGTFFHSLDFFYYLKNEIFYFFLLNLTSKGWASI